jgi:hypothetical protein
MFACFSEGFDAIQRACQALREAIRNSDFRRNLPNIWTHEKQSILGNDEKHITEA